VISDSRKYPLYDDDKEDDDDNNVYCPSGSDQQWSDQQWQWLAQQLDLHLTYLSQVHSRTDQRVRVETIAQLAVDHARLLRNRSVDLLRTLRRKLSGWARDDLLSNDRWSRCRLALAKPKQKKIVRYTQPDTLTTSFDRCLWVYVGWCWCMAPGRYS
jgi:hypothetical protein